MNLTLIHVGATEQRYYAEAAAEYEKRLGAFCKLKTVCIKDERLEDSRIPSEAQLQSALEAEAKRIKADIPTGAYTIALCVEGKQLSSEQLSEHITKLRVSGISQLCFIIGGSNGLAQSLKNEVDERLSMSSMTFPHQLFRVMLVEQIYRAFMISSGKRYHK